MIDITNDFVKALNHKGPVKSVVAIFYNPTTKTYLATEKYSIDYIQTVVEDYIKDARGKIELFKILPTKEFDRDWENLKYIPGLGLNVTIER